MSGDLHAKAREILMKNDRGGFTIPTARLYPFQWNWDSAFIALGIATYDADRAWRELETLAGAQAKDGMIPHIIFRQDDADYFPGPDVWGFKSAGTPTSGISQPPVLASVVRRLYEQTGARGRAAALFEPLLRWSRWFHENRKTENCPAVCAVHPWETGRDNSPDWDAAMAAVRVAPDLPAYRRRDIEHADPSQRPSQDEYDRYLTIVKFGRDIGWDQARLVREGPFLAADPGLHFILLRADKDLLALAEQLGENGAKAEIEDRIRQGESGADYIWNDELGAFCARDARSGRFSNGVSNAGALCFYAGAGSAAQKQRMLGHLDRIAGKVRFGQPSWDPGAPAFESQRYWRGPVWCQMNYMISQGLKDQGESALAEKMRQDLKSLIEISGFYECFDPVSGAGCIGRDFSWTAALWLAWAGPDEAETRAA